MVLSEEIDQSSNSIVIWLIRDNQITIQILCFLLKFDSLKTSSNETLSSNKATNATKIRNDFQNNFNRFFIMAKSLQKQLRLMLILTYEFTL